jgi:hypothetical protein
MSADLSESADDGSSALVRRRSFGEQRTDDRVLL